MSGDPTKKRRRRTLRATLSLAGIPEYQALIRKDMADALRAGAEDEPPEIAARLRYYAALFETGLKEE